MRQQQIAEIAKSLSVEQALSLTNHQPGQLFGMPDRGWGDASFSRYGRNMMDKGLIRWAQNPRDSRTILTPLGEEVRQYLLAPTQPHSTEDRG